MKLLPERFVYVRVQTYSRVCDGALGGGLLESNVCKLYNENEFERKLRLEKVVASKRIRLAVETEEERGARLEKMVATTQLRLAVETDEERIARLEHCQIRAQQDIGTRTQFIIYCVCMYINIVLIYIFCV